MMRRSSGPRPWTIQRTGLPRAHPAAPTTSGDIQQRPGIVHPHDESFLLELVSSLLVLLSPHANASASFRSTCSPARTAVRCSSALGMQHRFHDAGRSRNPGSRWPSEFHRRFRETRNFVDTRQRQRRGRILHVHRIWYHARNASRASLHREHAEHRRC